MTLEWLVRQTTPYLFLFPHIIVNSNFPSLPFLSSPLLGLSTNIIQLFIGNFQIIRQEEFLLASMQPPVHVHQTAIVVQANKEHIPQCSSGKCDDTVQEHCHWDTDVKSDVIVAIIAEEMPVQLECIANGFNATCVLVPKNTDVEGNKAQISGHTFVVLTDLGGGEGFIGRRRGCAIFNCEITPWN